MLVLTRRIGERIYIGDDIYITLLDIDRGKVRIGVVAPSNLLVLREELLTRRQEDNDYHANPTDPTTTSTDHAQDEHRRDQRH